MEWNENTLRRAEFLIVLVMVAVLLVGYALSKLW
jgi:hypothetical protein